MTTIRDFDGILGVMNLSLAAGGVDPLAFVCPERRALGNRYLKTVEYLNRLMTAQAEAIIRDGSELDNMETALIRARLRKDKAKEAFMAHVQSHGC